MPREITDAEVEAVATEMAHKTVIGYKKIDGANVPVYGKTLGAITVDADGLRRKARKVLEVARDAKEK